MPGSLSSPAQAAGDWRGRLAPAASRLKALTSRQLRGTWLLEHMAGRWRRRIGYSQFGEDLHLRSFYDRLAHDRGIHVTGGCIVDVGAFRPVVFSNSYGFYRHGWHCINIDPTPGAMRIFDKVRPRDTNLEVAIGPDDGEGTFYLFGTPSVWNTMDPEAAERARRATGLTPRQIAIHVRRLATILHEHLSGRPFELLSIDAEGYDLEILRSNDFTRFAPRLILIETHDVDPARLPAHPVVSHLNALGYRLHSWINPNLLFVRQDSLLDPP